MIEGGNSMFATFYNPSTEDTYLCSFDIDSENHLTVYDWNGVPFVCATVPEEVTASSRAGQARYIRRKLWFSLFVHLLIRYRKENDDEEAEFTADSLRLLEHREQLYYDEVECEWWDSWTEMIREKLESGMTKEEIREEMLYSEDNEDGTLYFTEYWKESPENNLPIAN